LRSLFRKEIPAPYVPQIDGDGDYRHFDQYAEVDTTVEYGQPGPDRASLPSIETS